MCDPTPVENILQFVNYISLAGGDERLIVIGGFGRQQIPLSDVEEFNPKTSQWDTLPVSKPQNFFLLGPNLG